MFVQTLFIDVYFQLFNGIFCGYKRLQLLAHRSDKFHLNDIAIYHPCWLIYYTTNANYIEDDGVLELLAITIKLFRLYH